MPRRKNIVFFLSVMATLILFFYGEPVVAWGTNARNDPFPMYTSRDPWDFLSYRERLMIRGFADEKGSPERAWISLSAFGQYACKGKILPGTYVPIPSSPTSGSPTANAVSGYPAVCDVSGPGPCSQVVYPVTSCFNTVELGDLDGRWNLLGLIAGRIPEGQEFPPKLLQAMECLCPNFTPGEITSDQIDVEPTVNGSTPTVPFPKTFGWASVPLKYRKRGIRWDMEALICGDFGLQFQGGVVEISQTLNCAIKNLTNLNTPPSCTTTPSSCPQLCTNIDNACSVDRVLFDQLPEISREIGLNICNFHKVGVEDIYLVLFWRHIHNVNFYRDLSWARLQVIPFFRAGGSIATGAAKDPAVAFSLPFGNNGHNSADVSVGINFDFSETVEIGGEVGLSHFFGRDVCNFRLPTNTKQSGIFPFSTTVHVQPGDTAYFAAKLGAYHFLERLSFWAEWVFVNHKEDHVSLIKCDPAFLVPKCPNTAWRFQCGNFGFNYDVSPSISFGFLWQQPFHVRNAYNSCTMLFNVTFVF